MKYPLDFVYDVKDLFPTPRFVHEMLENESPNVGRFLDDQIAYLSAIGNAAAMVFDYEATRNIAEKLGGVKKLYERYQEIAARQKDYAVQTHFRSIPVR